MSKKNTFRTITPSNWGFQPLEALSEYWGFTKEGRPCRLGVPLMAFDLQACLDFQQRPSELFEGKEMGEDSLRVLHEYRKLLHGISEIIIRESKILFEGLRWQKSVGLDCLD